MRIKFKYSSFLIFLTFSVSCLYAESIKNLKVEEYSSELQLKGVGNINNNTNGVRKIIQSFINQNDVVFDVGACEGSWSKLVLNHNAQIKLHVFEPSRRLYRNLHNQLSQNAKLNNIGLLHLKKTGTLYSFIGYPKVSTSYRRKYLRAALNARMIREKVEYETLDNYCRNNHIEKIDFLNITVEGSEYYTIKGSEQMLKASKIKCIMFEYDSTYKFSKSSLEKVFRYLVSKGYSIYRIHGNGLLHVSKWDSSLENYYYSNYIALLNDKFILDQI